MAQRGAEQRRPSIHDVASRAGVSAATVSKVMQGVTTVRPENAQRVFDAVQLLGYRVDPLASDLRRAKRRMIGAIVPEFESEFFGSMVTQLERLAEAARLCAGCCVEPGVRSARARHSRSDA